MDNVNILRRYGLFDAKVPRYTSYPPANRFLPEIGTRHQADWLEALAPQDPVSIYIHIPFCRRLCWFCACRTQGTRTLAPVEGYIKDLLAEIDAVASRSPEGTTMARLHLGGGTPTLLSADLMNRLLERVFASFPPAHAFEFSVEIDPTDAAPDVLHCLSDWNMRRASVGVQDFHPKVQAAIGRKQSFGVTQAVVDQLRTDGVESLNVDMLYGLPHQGAGTLVETLDRVVSLRPDRLALYGYAHVPHASKRQTMIPEEALPGAEQRFEMAAIAQDRLTALGYIACGIDHFALPTDSLARAAATGHLRRNFQGYTDDPCPTLLGFGASAISRFPQGYAQNAVATAAYRERIRATGLAAHKGFVMSEEDCLVDAMIDGIMCRGRLDVVHLMRQYPDHAHQILTVEASLRKRFPGLVTWTGDAVTLRPGFDAATRLLAAHIDQHIEAHHIHSMAI